MKKRTLLYFLLAAVSTLTVTAAAGCGGNDGGKPSGGTPCEHVDVNPADEKCDKCGVEMPKAKFDVKFDMQGHGTAPATQSVKEGEHATKPATDPTDADYDFVDWYKEAGCENVFNFETETITQATTVYAKWVEKSFEVKFDMQGSGEAIAPVTVKKGAKVTEPTTPTDTVTPDNQFLGWYKEKECITPFDFANETITGATTVYAKWKYETIPTTLDKKAIDEIATIEGVTLGSKSTVDVTYGKFWFQTNCQFENSKKDFNESVCVNNQGKDIEVTLGGVINSISFAAYCSSTSGNSKLTLLKKGEAGAVTDVTPTTGGWIVELPKGGKELVEFEATGLEAGTYIIRVVSGFKGARIGNFTLSEKLERAEANGITVSGAADAFLKGGTFDTAGLNVTLTYPNGRKDTLATGKYTVNSDAVKMDTAGKYMVTVSYTYKEGVVFNAEYPVYVYAAEELVLGEHKLDTKRNTLPLKTIYSVGDELDYSNLGVKVIASVTPEGEEKKTHTFYAKELTAANITAPDMTAAGDKEVTVTVGGVSATYNIHVLNLAAIDKTQVTVTVDGSGNVGVSENAVTVKTVNQAIQVYKELALGKEDVKLIQIAASATPYKEKVNIDLQNVKLLGLGTTAAETVLMYDGINGLLDPSGTTTYSTNGSATLTVAEGADGFRAENLEIRNYYNTADLYNASKLIEGLSTADGGGTQAVACLVMADKVSFKNVRFSGYHDTLYDMKGRHVYEDCYIEGRTDYIFGNDATSYFKNCTLKTLGCGDEKNGGYVVATKGAATKDGSSSLNYGYVFDHCTLTADLAAEMPDAADKAAMDAWKKANKDKVVAGTVSLARGWDKNMTLAFLNCNISSAYSKEKYNGTDSPKNDRYGKMNQAPNAAKLFEYNNTGDGALDQSTAGLQADLSTILTEAQAAEFTNLATIFAKVQKRTGATDYYTPYADNWNGVSGFTDTIKTVDLTSEPKGSTVTISDKFNQELTWEGMGKWNGNSVQVGMDTVITLKVKGDVSIQWYTGQGDHSCASVTYKNGYATIRIIKPEGKYIVSIKINTAEIPADTPTETPAA